VLTKKLTAVAAQVATAIDKAHRLGIVHRDLKPENIFLTTSEDRPPIIKVLDFGIVKLAEEGTGATGEGQIIGTPRYMAPEQASSGARITPATDRFALGLVAYRLLAGESYFRGDPINILAQLLHEPMRAPSERHPELGTAFDAWFLRACHRDPEQRFPSAAEQVETLAAALALPTIAATPGAIRRPSGTAPTTDRVTPRRKRPLIGIAVAAVAAGGAIAGFLLLRRPDGAERPAAAAATKAPPPLTPAASNTPPPPPVAPAPVAAERVPANGRPKAPPKAPHPAVTTTERPPAKAPPTTDPYADQK